MSDLRRIREVAWAEAEAVEQAWLQALTPAEGARRFAALHAMLRHQFQLTEALFQPEREQYLIELQSRLARFQAHRMNSMDGLIASVIQAQNLLEQAGIPSVVIGGLAVAVWGEPRATQDVDLRVLLRRAEAHKLLEVLGEAYVPFHLNPLENLARHGMIFVRDKAETRLDFLLADTSFDESAIARGRAMEIAPGQPIRVCSPEDLIIYKLLAPRGRDYDDVVSIVRRQQDQLDDTYILKWLTEFSQALDESNLPQEYEQIRRNRRPFTYRP